MRALLISAIAATTLGAGAAVAAPMAPVTGISERAPLVEQVASYRYRRDCIWVNGGWHYGQPGKYLVCRPYSPGRGYVWHSEGGRHGWYHSKRKSWHHNKW